MDYTLLNWGLMILAFAVMIGIGALSSRQEADDGLWVFACHFGERAMLGHAAIRTGIQTATQAGE